MPTEEHGPKALRGIEFQGYTIWSWCPTPDGSGPPEAVAFSMDVPGLPAPIIMRLKSRRAVDEMIANLKKHREDVWPENGFAVAEQYGGGPQRAIFQGERAECQKYLDENWRKKPGAAHWAIRPLDEIEAAETSEGPLDWEESSDEGED